MQAAGFVPYAGEWWHFADADAYPYEDLEQLRFPLDRQAVFEPLCPCIDFKTHSYFDFLSEITYFPSRPAPASSLRVAF